MASSPVSDPEKKVAVVDSDDEVLAQLGYTQGKWNHVLRVVLDRVLI